MLKKYIKSLMLLKKTSVVVIVQLIAIHLSSCT